MNGQNLGVRLRRARQERRLSLREVAALAGISASMLSQVENGKSQASVSTLHALVTTLELSMDELFQVGRRASDRPPGATDKAPGAHPMAASLIDAMGRRDDRSSPVQHPGDRPVLEMAGGVSWERLTNAFGTAVDAQLATYRPGSSSSSDGRFTRHNGVEFGYLISGQLQLKLGYEHYVVSAGDSLAFDSTLPHLYSNIGAVDAVGIWFEVGRHTADLLAATSMVTAL